MVFAFIIFSSSVSLKLTAKFGTRLGLLATHFLISKPDEVRSVIEAYCRFYAAFESSNPVSRSSTYISVASDKRRLVFLVSQ